MFLIILYSSQRICRVFTLFGEFKGIKSLSLCQPLWKYFSRSVPCSLIPTDQLDDYLEGLIHSSLPVVNLQTLQPLPHTAHAGATTATASVSQFPANCAATAFEIDPEGQCTIMAPQVSVDESSDERVSRLSTSCFQPPSPRLTRVETSDTNHEVSFNFLVHGYGIPLWHRQLQEPWHYAKVHHQISPGIDTKHSTHNFYPPSCTENYWKRF